MKPKKKNQVWTFIFSFMPGCAEMFTGLMKMGASILAVFFIMILIPAFLGLNDIFILGPVFVYIYAFFHARNISSLEDEELEALRDDYIWTEYLNSKTINFSSEKVRKWIAIVFVVLGIATLWNIGIDLSYNYIPSDIRNIVWPILEVVPTFVVAIALIILGSKMISAQKKSISIEDNSVEILSGETDSNRN